MSRAEIGTEMNEDERGDPMFPDRNGRAEWRMTVLAACVAVLAAYGVAVADSGSLSLRDLGYPGEMLFEGPATPLSVYFTTPRVTLEEGFMTWELRPSAALDPLSVFSFFLNDRLAARRSVADLRKNPTVSLALPRDVASRGFLHARIEPRLFITDDLCGDMSRGGLYYSVLSDSRLTLRYSRPPVRSTSDFFDGLISGAVVLLPSSPTAGEATAGIWAASILRKAYPGQSFPLHVAGESLPGSQPKILISSGKNRFPNPSVLPEGFSAVSGDLSICASDDTTLLLHVAALPVRQVFSGLGDAFSVRKNTTEKGIPAFVPEAEGAGHFSAAVELPVYPGLMPAPPADLTFHLEGVYTPVDDALRRPRLDLFWNGKLMKSERLDNSGSFALNLLVPKESGVFTRNLLRAVVQYPSTEGLCRYIRTPSRLRLLSRSFVTGYGTFPPESLTFDSFGLFGMSRGAVFTDGARDPDILRAAADLLVFLNRQYPEDVFLLPELRPLKDLANEGDRGYALVVATRKDALLPERVSAALPFASGAGAAVYRKSTGETVFSHDPSEGSAVLEVGNIGGRPLLAATAPNPEALRKAVSFAADPANAGELYGTLFVYRKDGARRSFDTRAPETGVRTLEPVAMAERTWFRYRGYILLSLWVLVAALLAKIALGNKRKVS